MDYLEGIQIELLPQSERKIVKSFNGKKYLETLRLLEKVNNVNHSRLLTVIKGYCYLFMNDYEKAKEIACDLFPFDVMDEYDVVSLRFMRLLYGEIGYKVIANRYAYCLNQLGYNFDVEEYGCNDQFGLLNFYLSHNMMAEFAVEVAFLRKNQIAFTEEIVYFLEIQKQIDDFANDLLMCDGNVIIADNGKYDYDNVINKLLMLDYKVNKVSVAELETNLCKDDSYIVFINSDDISSFVNESTVKHIEMFFQQYEKMEKQSYLLCFLYGDYHTAMERKYGYNFSNWSLLGEIDYSIVIPARNEGTYLKYAIESCLNITYNGTYEVLISDNSTESDSRVKDCVESFSDSRIRYIKTPKSLPLQKSFEFAYLSARGKRMLSIGADDAVLPNCLEILDKLFEENRGINIVNWMPCSYTWPSNGKKSDLRLTKYSNQCQLVDSKVALEEYKRHELTYTMVPRLYLGSCFDRSFIKTVMDITGKFLDGYSQDVYTGILVLLIEKNYLHYGLPLTTSGRSNVSVGMRDASGVRDENSLANLLKHDFGEYRYKNNLFGYLKVIDHIFMFCDTKILIFAEMYKCNVLSNSIFNSHKMLVDAINGLNKSYKHNFCDESLLENQTGKICDEIGIPRVKFDKVSYKQKLNLQIRLFYKRSRFLQKYYPIIRYNINNRHNTGVYGPSMMKYISQNDDNILKATNRIYTKIWE